LQLPGNMGSVHVSGNVSLKDGSFSLTSDEAVNLSLDGFPLVSQAGSITVSNSGASLAGSLTLPGNLGSAHVTGSVNSDGTFSLASDDDVNLSLNGFALVSQAGSVTVSNSGVSVSGDLQLTGLGSAQVSGAINSDGTFSLSG